MRVTTRNLWTVIPAAGESVRFRNAGHVIPKPLLHVRDERGVTQMMLDHVLAPLPKHNVVIGLPWTVRHTTGQADTIRQMIQHLPRGDKMIVCDCDTVLQKDDVDRVVRALDMMDAEVVAAVARSGDAAMSRIDKFPSWSRCAEKDPDFSEWGVIGLRAFNNIGDIYDALTWACLTHAEPYLSHAMNRLGGKKWAIEVSDWQDWGTPEKLASCGARVLPA